MPGCAFCSFHSQVVKSAGYPPELRSFITRCGAKPEAYTKEGRRKVRKVLEAINDGNPTLELTQSPEEMQGTKFLLENSDFATAENFEMAETKSQDCRKNLGEIRRLNNYSRGILQAVGGGGIVDYFAAIFDSEGRGHDMMHRSLIIIYDQQCFNSMI